MPRRRGRSSRKNRGKSAKKRARSVQQREEVISSGPEAGEEALPADEETDVCESPSLSPIVSILTDIFENHLIYKGSSPASALAFSVTNFGKLAGILLSASPDMWIKHLNAIDKFLNSGVLVEVPSEYPWSYSNSLKRRIEYQEFVLSQLVCVILEVYLSKILAIPKEASSQFWTFKRGPISIVGHEI